MRISLAYSIFIASSIQLLALDISGQTIDKELVTIELQNDNLVAMVKKIEAQSTLRFIYLPEQLSKYESVTLARAKRTVKETLDLVLIGTGLGYEQNGRYVVLRDKHELVSIASIATLSLNASLVKGKVTGEDGQGIAGVSIVVKGTTSGTTTDVNGDYGLVAEADDVLIFSFIGYKTQEVNVASRTTVDVALIADVTALKEVVVKAGYYDVNKREMPGNISSITSSEIQRQPVANPLAAMIGRIPGMYIQQFSGIPGGNFTVRIRGRNSIDGGNDPLYVIDGVPFISESLSSIYASAQNLGALGSSPLNGINQNDIESVEVLKDADATAIYGSRGANGVVLITTKKGPSGKTTLDFNVNSGVSSVGNEMKMLNTSQYLLMRREALNNDGIEAQPWDNDINGAWDTTRYTNWQKVLMGKRAQFTNAQFSISGGNKTTQILFSGAFNRQTTVFPGEFAYSKGSSHFSGTHSSLNQKLKASFSINYVVDNNDLAVTDLTNRALTLPPDAPSLYDSAGGLNWQNSTWQNPLAYLKQKYNGKNNTLIANAVLSYRFFSRFEFKINIGFNDARAKEISITPSTYYDPAYAVNSDYSEAYFASASTQSWIIEPQMTWSRDMKLGQVSVLIGSTFQQRLRDQLTQYALGFPNNLLLEDIDAAHNIYIADFISTNYKYAAVFGRANYNFNGKYIVNLTGRRDGSSRFGTANRFANFGAIGLAWVFSSETFAKEHLSVLSFGKLRFSYGTSGNDQIGDYEYIDAYESLGIYNGVTGLSPARLYNSNFAWEMNKKLEGGLELGFFRDRVLLNVSYYRNRSSSQLVNYPLALTTGFSGIRSNLNAQVQNTGVELELKTINIREDEFEWTSNLNFTVPRNKLVSFPGLEGSSYSSRYVIGQPLAISRVFQYQGVNSETGLYQFQDVNRDNAYSLDDTKSVFVGQKYYGGFNNTFMYKGLQLDVFLQFVKQTGFSFPYFTARPGEAANQTTEVMSRWTHSGDKSNIQKFATFNNSDAVDAYQRYVSSDAVIVNSSFVRLKNVSVSYTLPSTILKSLSCRVYLQGQNLLTFTNYVGMDPETNGGFRLPPLRTYVAGLQFTF